ncbi:hypothetical protein RHMOL_Rhmol04G0161000 [Rhododendron molle]|uniref:Uncharacterized protein n=1 Tax=Rhododendron molle TaxID=49168 RepID=A0ACC0P3I8_RHOML|nr:hypothetical protein RHMOL_Rhmol04G0161000 [Rhododendron molle]
MDTRGYSMKVLVQPWLAYGHISPYLELAKKLSERNFYIYFCSTPINLSTVRKKLDHKYLLSIQLVELHLPSLPDLPPSHHTTNGLPAHLMTTLKTAFDTAANSDFPEILRTLTPDLVIYDQNQPWAPAVASSHNIPAIQFLTFGAAVVSFGLHMFKNPGEAFPYPEMTRSRNFKRSTVHGTGKQPSGDEIMKEVHRFLESVNRSCDIILVKSFREIEGKYIDYLSTLAEKKILPVGPLVEDRVDMSEDENSKDIIQWLDKKEKSSTVFVSFGSECFLTKEEIEELAYGLELSQVNFIWVVRFPVGENVSVDLALPEGFLGRVKERGIVVEGWAPQVEILRHSSIGGFVSHCGWNSAIESMKFGVPIIGVPMQIDQPLNARLIEETAGIGVEVRRDESGGLQREEIAQVIRRVVVEKDGEGVRTNARKLSESMGLKKEEEIDGVVDELLRLFRKGK